MNKELLKHGTNTAATSFIRNTFIAGNSRIVLKSDEYFVTQSQIGEREGNAITTGFKNRAYIQIPYKLVYMLNYTIKLIKTIT